MDKATINARRASAVGENIWRAILVFVALVAGFSAWPDQKLFVGASLLAVMSGLRLVMLNNEIQHLVSRRTAWYSGLTAQFAMTELHNLAVKGHPAFDSDDGSNWVWDHARKAARDDLSKFDVDEGGLGGIDNKSPWWLSVVHVVLTAIGDLGLAAVAAFLTT